MNTITEMEIKISGGRIIRTEVKEDGSCKLVVKLDKVEKSMDVVPESDNLDDILVFVEASGLSLDDEFLQYEPETHQETVLKEMIKLAIERKIDDFYMLKIDPSFTEDGDGIRYVPGMEPAIGNCYTWWLNAAKAYNRARRSRLGTADEYVAALGVCMKQLVAGGHKVKDVWNYICNGPNSLENFTNSKKIVRKRYGRDHHYMFGMYLKENMLCGALGYSHYVSNRNEVYNGVGWVILEV